MIIARHAQHDLRLREVAARSRVLRPIGPRPPSSLQSRGSEPYSSPGRLRIRQVTAGRTAAQPRADTSGPVRGLRIERGGHRMHGEQHTAREVRSDGRSPTRDPRRHGLPVPDTVAAFFGKRHDNVLLDLENLVGSEPDSGLSNFGETPYVEPTTWQTYRSFDRTATGSRCWRWASRARRRLYALQRQMQKRCKLITTTSAARRAQPGPQDGSPDDAAPSAPRRSLSAPRPSPCRPRDRRTDHAAPRRRQTQGRAPCMKWHDFRPPTVGGPEADSSRVTFPRLFADQALGYAQKKGHSGLCPG